MIDSNPASTPLPQFSKIRADQIVPDLESLLDENIRVLEQTLENNSPYTWGNLVVPLEELDDRLNKFWSPVRHLHSVADNDDLRKAYNICLEKITTYSTDMMQNHDLYLAYRQLAENEKQCAQRCHDKDHDLNGIRPDDRLHTTDHGIQNDGNPHHHNGEGQRHARDGAESQGRQIEHKPRSGHGK